MTTKKNASLLTMGPISAISWGPEGKTPRSESFVHARNQQLRGNYEQHHGGDREKLPQVDLERIRL